MGLAVRPERPDDRGPAVVAGTSAPSANTWRGRRGLGGCLGGALGGLVGGLMAVASREVHRGTDWTLSGGLWGTSCVAVSGAVLGSLAGTTGLI